MIKLKEILNEPTTGKRFTAKVFRGDDKKFDKFDTHFIGKSTGIDTLGFWFTSSEENAGFYGEHIREFEITIENPKVFTEEEITNGWPNKASLTDYVKEAMVHGHDGVIFINVMDGYTHSNIYCIFDPDNIKFINNKSSSQ